MDTAEVLRIAEADLQRRLEAMSGSTELAEVPQVDAQIEETLKIAERELVRREGEALHWDAEFNFWHRIVTGEVERTRFNEGYEPVRIDLYPAGQALGAELGRSGAIAFLGETQVGHVKFQAVARWACDAHGRRVLRLAILKAK